MRPDIQHRLIQPSAQRQPRRCRWGGAVASPGSLPSYKSFLVPVLLFKIKPHRSLLPGKTVNVQLLVCGLTVCDADLALFSGGVSARFLFDASRGLRLKSPCEEAETISQPEAPGSEVIVVLLAFCPQSAIDVSCGKHQLNKHLSHLQSAVFFYLDSKLIVQ